MIKSNYPLMIPGPTVGMSSMAIFLKNPSPYLREFRRKPRKNPNDTELGHCEKTWWHRRRVMNVYSMILYFKYIQINSLETTLSAQIFSSRSQLLESTISSNLWNYYQRIFTWNMILFICNESLELCKRTKKKLKATTWILWKTFLWGVEKLGYLKSSNKTLQKFAKHT